MFLIKKIKRYFNIIFKAKVDGKQITYEPAQEGDRTKVLAESLKEILALYAAYSEVGEKFLKLFPYAPARVAEWGRLITSALAIFLSGHVLVSWKTGNPNTYSYSKFPRILAGIVLLIVAFAFGHAIYDLFFSPPTIIQEAYSLSFQIPSNSWHLQPTKALPQEEKIYSANINVSGQTKSRYTDIEVHVQPYGGFELVSVNPQTTGTVKENQVPIMKGELKPTSSRWHFQDFNEGLQWEIIVHVKKVDPTSAFPQNTPVQATIYLYK